MCGIIGAVGQLDATNTVLLGLETLEYRGYDSCGLCYKRDGKLKVNKVSGRVKKLKERCSEISNVAIGHTRWATHGKPTAENAHPHLSYDGAFAVVHNGIVENLETVKSIIGDVPLKSQTDSELIAHLIAKYYDGNVRRAVEKAAETMEGTFTFLTVSIYDDNIYAYRKNASLIVGFGNGFNLVASDMLAISEHCDKCVVLQDDDLAEISRQNVAFFRFGKRVEYSPVDVFRNKSAVLSAPTFMQSEIEEIPSACKNTVASLLSPEGLAAFDVNRKFDSVFICGCGTAYHASLYGKTVFEKIAKLPTFAEVASEIKNDRLHLTENTLAIFVSQSGETRDTISALRYAKSLGVYSVSLTNVRGSSLSLEADFSLYLDCGAEIAVAATKTLTSQMIALYLFSAFVAFKQNAIDRQLLTSLIDDAKRFEIALRKAVCDERICKIAQDFYLKKTIYLGSGQDYAVALEGALKLKEITYKSTEAYRLGELKHGPIALVDDNTFCIISVSDENLAYRAEITASELETRGAKTLMLAPFSHNAFGSTDTPLMLRPIESVVYLQKYALVAAEKCGLDPDKPRNLAKSVTVL